MRISLSEKDHVKGRHLVLVVDRAEEIAGANRVIEAQVMDGKKAVRETVMRSVAGKGEVIDHVVYRFHLRYLERLHLTFPQAEWTLNAENYRRRMLLEEVLAGPVPKIKVPGFKGNQIFGFQKKAIKWTEDQLDDHGSAMINNLMGTGKTIVVYSVIDRDKSFFTKQAFKKILVITTNSGKMAWWKIAKDPVYLDGKQVEPAKFPGLDISIVDGTKAQRKAQLREDHHITIINEHMLRTTGRGYVRSPNDRHSYPEIFKTEWDLIIADEYHHFRNPSIQAAKGFLRLKTKALILMSGTPFLNRPEELWPALTMMAPDDWPDHGGFVSNLPIYGKGHKLIGYNRHTVRDIRDFLKEHSIRQTKADVDLDLPEVMPPMEIRVERSEEEKKLYSRLRDEFIIELDDGKIKHVTAILAHITRLKQACFSPELYGGSKISSKMDKLKEIIAELVASGEKAIIFSQWETACQIIQRELSDYQMAYVTGKVNTKERSKQEDLFNQNPDCKLYVGTIDANQESISLGAATYVIFTDQPWNPYKKAQAQDRSASGGLRGIQFGKNKKVHVIDLHASDSIEEWIDQILARKSRLFNTLIEAGGGKEIKKTQIDDIRTMLLKEAA